MFSAYLVLRNIFALALIVGLGCFVASWTSDMAILKVIYLQSIKIGLVTGVLLFVVMSMLLFLYRNKLGLYQEQEIQKFYFVLILFMLVAGWTLWGNITGLFNPS